ncbi:MAG: transposase [Anaerolineaceae bacterium]|nr:transposase [Anaerolineaceae bacterium]
MAYSILVATAHTPFGELIRLSLEETRRYRVQVVDSGIAAEQQLNVNAYTLAIVDADLQDLPFSLLTQQVQQGLKVFGVPPSEGSASDAFTALPLSGTLKRPFYLPDLLDLVAQAVEDAPAAPDPLPVWPTPAAQTPASAQPAEPTPEVKTALPVNGSDSAFANLLEKTNALAGLWMARGRGAYQAGPAAADVARELTEQLQSYWQKGERGEVVRFVRLPIDDGDCQLYLITLEGDQVLGMVFSAKTPFSKVRNQVGKLIQDLAQRTSKGEPAPPVKVPPTAEEDRWYVEDSAEPLNGKSGQAEMELTGELDDALEAQLQNLDLEALLGSIPNPDPQNGEADRFWDPDQAQPTVPSWAQPESQQPEVTQPVQTGTTEGRFVMPEEGEETSADLAPASDAQVLTPPTSLNQLDPASAGVSQIYYTCVLIPRLPQHYLTREIGERVGQWVQQLCLAFGWRLEGIAIRPEYLQWMVQVAPSVSPANVVKVIRQRTSHYLFNAFERIRDENPSDDFWASGYLIISGAQPPAAKLLREFIVETRRRQGITRLPQGGVPSLNEPPKP